MARRKQTDRDDRIRVRATQTGLYGELRQPGAEFHIETEEDFHPSWMEHVDEDGQGIEKSPVLKRHYEREHERRLRAHEDLRRMNEMGGLPPEVPKELRDWDKDQDDKPARPPGLKRTDDLGVYSRDGTLQKEVNTGNPLVEPGAVGRPGQSDKDRPQPFDARHDAEQDLSIPHQLKDGTAKKPEMDKEKGTRAADKKPI